MRSGREKKWREMGGVILKDYTEKGKRNRKNGNWSGEQT
jgi:hypothetical protein